MWELFRIGVGIQERVLHSAVIHRIPCIWRCVFELELWDSIAWKVFFLHLVVRWGEEDREGEREKRKGKVSDQVTRARKELFDISISIIQIFINFFIFFELKWSSFVHKYLIIWVGLKQKSSWKMYKKKLLIKLGFSIFRKKYNCSIVSWLF